MYEHFEKGLCDQLSLKPTQISNEARGILKKAFADAYTVPGQEQQEEPQQHSGIPWKGLGLGLLGAAGAYGYGKYNPQGITGGFAQGVDNWIKPAINPIKNFFNPPPSTMAEAQGMDQRMDDASINGALKDVHTPSQLQGTQFYQPGKLENVTNTTSDVAGAADLSGMAARGVMGATGKIAPQFAARAGVSAIGGGLATGAKALGRFATPLSAVMSIPDSMQLGDKLNDKLNIQNKWGRGAVQAGTVAGGIGGAVLGAESGAALGSIVPGVGTAIGGIAGGLIGGMAPGMANSLINRFQNNKVLQNQTAGRLGAVNSEFQNAMSAKAQGNNNPMQAWYGLQSPQQLQQTINFNKGNGALQDQMHMNNPNRPL